MTDIYFDIKRKSEENNADNVPNLLLVPESEKTEAGINMLKAIITALKMDISKDFSLLWVPETGISAGRLFSGYAKILIMGCEPALLDINIEEKKYRLLNMEGQQLLFSDPPSVLVGDTQKKGQLWNCLQTLFELAKS